MIMKEMAYKIEDLLVAAEKINSLQCALFEAVYNGNYSIEDYRWAFTAVNDLTYSLINQTKELEDQAFDSLGKNLEDEKQNA